jgi:CRISPR-associated protein (TIGR03986 family)
MSLTLTQRQNQLKALLNANAITQAEYDRRMAALAQAPAPAAPVQTGYGGNQPQQQRYTARRPDASEFVRAPYRFVPYDGEALVPAEPESATGNIHEPKAEGLSAEIVVQWEAEGPLLVGQEGADGIVTPMRWAQEPAGFFIPGSTLRGAIRSVAEIIGCGRLAKAHVNLSQSFALRDFTHKAYSNSREDIGAQDGQFPLADMRKLKAGWLRLKDPNKVPSRDKDDAMLGGRFEIVSAPGWHRIEVEDIWRLERPRGNARDAKDFTKQTMVQKYSAMGLTRRVNGKEVPSTDTQTREFKVVSQQDRIVAPQKGGPIKGHYAFSGKSPSGKKYEYIIEAMKGGEKALAVEINEPIWQRFVRAHSQAVKEKLKPDGAWKDIPAMFRADPDLKLPVFYVGNLETQPEDSFAFGITRLFKVPHSRTLEQVLTASGAADPVQGPFGAKWVDPRQLDIVDALFGFVYEGKEKGADWAQSPSDVARKGRVAFSAAALVKGRPQITQPVETVMMAPRPSFAPFYLKGTFKDYSAPKDETLTIAGRKRYPVRQAPGVSAQAAFQSVKARLTGQIDAIKAMNPRGEGPGKDVTTRLQFLLPQEPAQNLVFESRIRLHNVTRAELGLVLDAVTLGGKAHLRHAIGRAKPFGAGQMKATVTGLVVEWNAKAGIEHLDAAEQAGLLKVWQDYRDARLREAESKRKTPKEVAYDTLRATFEACCNPAVGAKLDLTYLRLNEQPQGANRPDKPYLRLRDWVKPMKNAADPTAPRVLLTIK